MIPKNETVSCVIEEGYLIEVWFTTTGDPYIGELNVTDDNGTTVSSTIIIRTHDFGSYSDIPVIPVSILANSSKFNLFFSTLDENVIGIRNWVIYWLFVLFGFAVIMSLRK